MLRIRLDNNEDSKSFYIYIYIYLFEVTWQFPVAFNFLHLEIFY